MITMISYRLMWILLLLLMFVTHVASHRVKGDSSEDSVTVAQINVQIFLGGNSTSNGFMTRNMMGMKGEKGDREKAGPPARSSTREQMQLQLLFATGSNRRETIKSDCSCQSVAVIKGRE